MSDEDRSYYYDDDDSDDEDYEESMEKGGKTRRFNIVSSDKKREHHNLLERKRRYSIRDSFQFLRDLIPDDFLQGDQGKIKASRAQILKGAAKYISDMEDDKSFRNDQIDELKKNNEMIEKQILELEKLKRKQLTTKNNLASSQRVPTSSFKIKRHEPYQIKKSENSQGSFSSSSLVNFGTSNTLPSPNPLLVKVEPVSSYFSYNTPKLEPPELSDDDDNISFDDSMFEYYSFLDKSEPNY